MLYVQWLVYTNLVMIQKGELNAVRDTQEKIIQRPPVTNVIHYF